MAYEIKRREDNRDAVDVASAEPAPATPAQQAVQPSGQTASAQQAEQSSATAPQTAQPSEQAQAQQVAQQSELLNEDGTLNTASADPYARYREKLSQLGSARMAIAEMMRPEEEERKRRERSLRRVALGQAIGDIVGGLFGFGIAQRNGSTVVVPESQATKTHARLQKLQEEGLADRENYRKLLGNLRLKTLEDELAAEKGIADKEAANAQQLALLEARLKAQAEREDKKDKQWQTTQNERERHNRAMEAIGANRANGKSGKSGGSRKGTWAEGFSDLDYRLITVASPKERVTTTTKEGKRQNGKTTRAEDFVIKNEAEAKQILANAKRRLQEFGLPYDDEGIDMLEHIKTTKVKVPSLSTEPISIERLLDSDSELKKMFADGRLTVDEIEYILSIGKGIDGIKNFVKNKYGK